MKTRLLIIAGIVLQTATIAQDIHFSQYWENPVLLNPGFSGTDKAKIRINSVHRNQWGSVGNIFTTSALAGDFKLNRAGRSSSFGAGTFVLYDKAASGSLSRFSAGTSLASSVHIGKNKYLSLGIQFSYNQNSVRFGNSTWDAQYNNEFDASRSSNENLSVSGKNFFDAGAGFVFYKNGNSRDFNSKNDNSFQFGVSAFHLNQPDIGIYGSDKMKIRYNGFIKMDFVLASKFSLQPVVYYARQGNLQEINTGSLLRYSLSEQNMSGTSKTKTIAFGLFYRYGDSMYPVINFECGSWLAGLSYDMNISNLSEFTQSKGGFEVCLKYRYLKVDEEKSKKSF